MKRFGSTTWNGALRDGKGAVSTESRALESYFYSFFTRYDEKPGTNPGPDRTRTDLLGISMRCRQAVRTANPSDRKPTQILMVGLLGCVSNFVPCSGFKIREIFEELRSVDYAKSIE
jgi:hypothetical protein